MSAPDRAVLREKAITRPATTMYAHYECDHCHEPIGYTGTVKIRDEMVWSVVCAQCAAEAKRL